jgi:hypothetical protein
MSLPNHWMVEQDGFSLALPTLPTEQVRLHTHLHTGMWSWEGLPRTAQRSEPQIKGNYLAAT